MATQVAVAQGKNAFDHAHVRPRTASIVAGLPIAVMLLLMGYGLAKTLHEDFPLPDVEDKMALRYLNR